MMSEFTFEERKFCQMRTLAGRWDCSVRHIQYLVNKGLLRSWHPEGKNSTKGLRVEVSSVLKIEREGYLEYAENAHNGTDGY
jgi:hypothetical protein